MNAMAGDAARNDTARNEEQIEELIDEVIVTFRLLRVASAEIHGEGAPMPGQRGVLIDLARMGPQTVAAMARSRGVSRQHVQALVDGFLARGLVELAENPAHRRSKLVRLTRDGKVLVQRMLARERAALGSLNLGLPPARIRSAAAVLRALRQRLQDYSLAHRRSTPGRRVSRRT
jgi:DNA-binding MarR family transcriptional regulator